MKLFDYPGPSFCIQGWPSRIYTDATCLAALLLYFEGVRKGAQSFAAELADPFGLFHSYEFSRFIKKKLVHHHHNPRLADCLLVAGVPLLVVLPSPFLHLKMSSGGAVEMKPSSSVGYAMMGSGSRLLLPAVSSLI
jgi:hypothetical protein